MPGGGEGGSGFGVVGGTGAKKPTMNDAFTYLQEVKEAFLNQEHRYLMFMQIMKDFKNQRISAREVIPKVKELFKGHDNLIYRFNSFLPKGYQISSIQEGELPPKSSLGFGEAIEFVIKVKNRFKNDVKVHKSFIDILSKFRYEDTPIEEVKHEATLLLKDHPDLLVELTKFFPENVESQQLLPFGPESATNTAMATLLQTLKDRMTGGGKKEGPGSGVIGESSAKKLTIDDALSYLQEVKKTFRDEEDKYGCLLTLMQDFKNTRIDEKEVVTRVKELLKGHNNLIIGFSTFLPEWDVELLGILYSGLV